MTTIEAGAPEASAAARSGASPRLLAVGRTLLRKAIDIVVVVLVAATATFVMFQAMPGKPEDVLLKGIFQVTPEVREEVIRDFGLDRPVIEQYFQYLGGLIRGDLGQSFQQRQPVTQVIADSLGPTAALAGAALVLAILIAVGSAVLTSGRGPVATVATQVVELLAISVPSFWIGLLLLTAFSFVIPIFPSSGGKGFDSLVLPAITLAIPITGILAQVLRERFDEALGQPFITTVRTRGATEVRVRLVHALRHAVIPALTFSGAILGSLLVGTAVVETLFARPGLGRTLLTAVIGNDVPLVMGIIVFGSLVFVVVNSIVDVLAAAIDPRSKLETPRGAGW